MDTAHLRFTLSLLVVALVALAGCGGGGGGTPGTPGPSGSSTLRGTVALPSGQSAADLVVKVEGTPLQARPAPDGSFEIAGVPPGNHTVSAFSATTNVGAQVTVLVGASGEVRVPNIQLGPAGQIAGIVTAFDAAGVQRPHGGATIVARPGGDVYIMQAGVSMPRPAGQEGQTVDPDVRLTATSAEDGTYAFKGVAPGAYILTATLDGFEPQEQFAYVDVARTAAADFAFGRPLEPGVGKLSGKVLTKAATGELKPVAGAQVTVDWGAMYGGGTPPPNADGTVMTPNTGGAMIPNTGGVMTPNGQAAGMASLLPPGGYGYAVTDEAGNYTLMASQGRRSVQCRHRDYLAATAEVDVKDATTLDFTLEPAPGERPKLELTAAVGKPSYPWGEPVELSLALKNVGTVPVTLSFDAREASFGVLRGEEVVWAFGSGYYWPMPMLTAEARSRRRATETFDAVLRPGDTRDYRAVWDQRRFDGTVVDPGDFALRGMIVVGNQYDASSTIEASPVKFQITR